MQIAYVTTYSAADIAQWSGLGFYIARCLEDAGMEIETVGPLSSALSRLLLLKKAAHLGLGGRTHLIDREPSLARRYAALAARHLRHSRADVVFSPGSIPIGHLDCDRPIVFWTDATFAGVLDFYPEFSNLTAATIRNGHALERAALDQCRLAIYSSAWAARTAIETYAADPSKIAVVPFGANIEIDFGHDEVRGFVANRPTTMCQLLFIGAAWERKGGPLALEVTAQLNARGIPTTLTIVGCRPPLGHEEGKHARVLGPMSKARPDERARLRQLLADAHFLILPSEADCTPVAFSEANAFGVPCLASDVGGIPSVITDGINGFCFSKRQGAAAYADCVERYLRLPARYCELALGARSEYDRRLNWRVAGAAVKSLLEAHCA